MPTREEYLRTIRRESDSSIPYFFCFCKTLVDKFEKKYGHMDYRKEYNIPLREVFLNPTRLNPKEVFHQYLTPEEKEGIVTEWGIILEPSDTAHFSHMVGPLRNATTVEEVEVLPFPDFLEDYRWVGVRERIAELKKEGKIIFPGIYGGLDIGTNKEETSAFMDIFESSWYLCGLDKFLMDMVVDEEYVEALLDKMTELKCQLAKKWTEAGVDILITADDVGMQEGMMISVEMYQKWIKPRLKKVIDAAKSVNPEVLIFYHSDGDIWDIIPDLLEVGVEILNPIQPECMNPIEVMEKYGDRCSFWGTIGTQTTLPFGSVADVESACRAVLDARVGKGGLILAPTHLVEPEVPLENIEMLVEMAHEYSSRK